jgi:hypothetical protein
MYLILKYLNIQSYNGTVIWKMNKLSETRISYNHR